MRVTVAGIVFDDLPPLMSAEELAEFLNITKSQLAHFRHEHGLHRVKGTSKYSTVTALERILGETSPPQSTSDFIEKLNKRLHYA